MTAYQETIYERRQMAIGAKKRKCGAKSRKCGFPSDMMSKKELEKMNGEVKCYNVLVPWTWSEFKNAPDDICQEYLDRLSTVYRINQSMLAMMFSKTAGAVRTEIKKRGLKFESPHGTPSSEVKRAWIAFVFKKNDNDKKPSVTPCNAAISQENGTLQVTGETDLQAGTGSLWGLNNEFMHKITSEFQGTMNREAFYKMLENLLPSDGNSVRIEVSVARCEDTKQKG